jgi:hypothetical protein
VRMFEKRLATYRTIRYARRKRHRASPNRAMS